MVAVIGVALKHKFFHREGFNAHQNGLDIQSRSEAIGSLQNSVEQMVAAQNISLASTSAPELKYSKYQWPAIIYWW